MGLITTIFGTLFESSRELELFLCRLERCNEQCLRERWCATGRRAVVQDLACPGLELDNVLFNETLQQGGRTALTGNGFRIEDAISDEFSFFVVSRETPKVGRDQPTHAVSHAVVLLPPEQRAR